MASITKPRTDGIMHKEELLSTYLEQHTSPIRLGSSYTTIQEAINAAPNATRVAIGVGQKEEKVSTKYANLHGEGSSTVLKGKNFSEVITLDMPLPHWQYRHIGDFNVDGTGTSGCTAMSFGDNAFSGRYIIERVNFTNLDTGIMKPSGNIGNIIKECSFSGLNWGYRAVDHKDMHAGCDTLKDVHMDGINTYAVYINAQNASHTGPTLVGGGVGAFKLRDSIIESSKGGGVYIKDNGTCPASPNLISATWFEAIASTEAVQVDGVAQKPRIIKLENGRIMFVEYSYINNIELVNSNLVTYGCRFDNADGRQDIVVDANSSIIAHDAYLNGSSGPNVIVESIASQSATLGTPNLSLRGNITKGRLFNPPAGIKKKAITFDSGSTSFTGAAQVQGQVEQGGLHAATCTSFQFGGAIPDAELEDSRVTLTKDKWYVWGINAKLVSGTVRMSLIGGITLGDIYLESGRWVSTFGVAKAGASETTGIHANTAGVSGGKVMLSDYFVVEFDTERDAMMFANLRMSLAQ